MLHLCLAGGGIDADNRQEVSRILGISICALFKIDFSIGRDWKQLVAGLEIVDFEA